MKCSRMPIAERNLAMTTTASVPTRPSDKATDMVAWARVNEEE